MSAILEYLSQPEFWAGGAIFGVIGTIVGFFLDVLKSWFIESHKSKLRKSEAIFPYQLNAAKAFALLHGDFLPSYSHPDMDWYEACEDIASVAGRTEGEIRKYLREHSTVLSNEVEKLLCDAEDIARKISFEMARCNPDNNYPEDFSREAIELADNLYDKLVEAKKGIAKQLQM